MKPKIYYCDYKKRNSCDNSPFCVANGGQCMSTADAKWAMLGIHGEPLVNHEFYKEVKIQNESKLEGTFQK